MFECLKFKAADNCWYTPDFVVVDGSGNIEVWEVKGGKRLWAMFPGSRIKIKVCAEKYQGIHWIGATKKPKKEGGGWQIENFSEAYGLDLPDFLKA